MLARAGDVIGLKREDQIVIGAEDVRRLLGGTYRLRQAVRGGRLDGKRVAFAAMLSDVDTAEDYRRECAHGALLIAPAKMPHRSRV